MVFGLGVTLVANGQEGYSLVEAVEFAQKNSLMLQGKQLDISDANEQVREYMSIGLPKLGASLGYNYFPKLPTSIFPNFIEPAIYDVLFDENLLPRRDLDPLSGVPVQFGTRHNATASLELSTLLFDGSFLVGLKGQRMYKELLNLQLAQSQVDVRYSVTQAYLAVLLLQENRRIVAKNLENLRRMKLETGALFQSGFAERLDVDRLDLTVQQLETQADQLVKLEEVSLQMLKFQMNYPTGKSLTLTDRLEILLNKSYLEVMDPTFTLQLEARPEHAVLSKSIELAQVNIKRLRYSYYPSLVGFGGFSESLQRTKLFDSDDNGWFATANLGIQLNWQIFDGRDRKAKLARARITRDRTQLGYQQFSNAATLEYQNARTEYVNSLLVLDNRKKSLALAEKIYGITLAKYREGLGSSFELSSSERDLYQSQADLLNAQYELVASKVRLDKSMGKL
ncbi:MAG: hypothetical protein JPMHGGIA_02136 [Saprospiraceae bacterium]|nr:hypothetical protein [Saprospiraceae bacterium]